MCHFIRDTEEKTSNLKHLQNTGHNTMSFSCFLVSLHQNDENVFPVSDEIWGYYGCEDADGGLLGLRLCCLVSS
jgi:hypothetical protein